MSDHLTPAVTDRGFKHLPPIRGTYPRDQIRVSESSAATGPQLWLTATEDDDGGTPVHLDAEAAFHLAEQIVWLLGNHYQGNALPEALGEVIRAVELHQDSRSGPESCERCERCGHARHVGGCGERLAGGDYCICVGSQVVPDEGSTAIRTSVTVEAADGRGIERLDEGSETDGD